jgi:Protein of unknown function (DUF2934)
MMLDERSWENVEGVMSNSTENEYPPEATIGDQWQRGETGKSRETIDIFLLSPTELHQRIAQLAYDLYLHRGRAHGRDLEDWLVAERNVLMLFTGISQDLEEETNGKEI